MLRRLFFAQPGHTSGRHEDRVAHQSAAFPENVAFSERDVVFGTVHVVGSNDDHAPWFGDRRDAAGNPLPETRRETALRSRAPQVTFRASRCHAVGVNWWQWLLIAAGVALVIYAAFVIGLLLVGRRQDARAVAGFVPDCVVLFRRLLGDDRVPRRRKLLLAALIGYLALPFDLVPDFIPIAGTFDDAIIVAIVLRTVLRAGGPELLREHWPGPAASFNALMRLAYGSPVVP